jgi:hypothetical protein
MLTPSITIKSIVLGCRYAECRGASSSAINGNVLNVMSHLKIEPFLQKKGFLCFGGSAASDGGLTEAETS